MHKKMAITIDEAVYDGLHKIIGRGHISQFFEEWARPYVLKEESLDAGYQTRAADVTREVEARKWCNAFNLGAVDNVADSNFN